jgi:predicted nucleotidyltransferase
MTHPAPHHPGSAEGHASLPAEPLPDALLNTLVTELDNDYIVGITLGGSYVRGEATPYSDVDLACWVKDAVNLSPRRFVYRDNRLISIGTKTVTAVREDLSKPERAILFVAGQRRVLLDKDGSVTRLVQEVASFTWEPLQPAANQFASLRMMLLAEWVHKILSGLFKRDELALSFVISEFFFSLTEAVAVQRGILIKSGSTYYRQVQDAIGQDSAWTRYHRQVAGVDPIPAEVTPVITRSIASLHLYRETVALLRPTLQPDHLAIAEQAIFVAQQAHLH